MRQSHVGGDKLFVDYAGDGVSVIIDRLTGEVRDAQIFVAVTLPWMCRTSFDLGMPPRILATVAKHLTAKERVGLFCAAADIDHTAVGILSSTMQTLDARGLITRDSSTGRYQLTDTGRAVLGVLLERGGTKPEG